MHPDDPLSDKEFQELDRFLLSDRCADDGMTMDSLHGYVTAIAIGPEQILMSEWLPKVWGSKGEAGPAFKNEKERERIVGLIARFANEVTMTFEVAPKEFEPLFCTQEIDGRTLIDAEGWAWGFWEGMQLRAGAWEPAWAANIGSLLRTIYLLGAEEIEEEEMLLVDDPVKRDRLALEMESAIPHIHRFWLPLRRSAVQQVKHETPKVGRNDVCACGSGKKFKKCCGAEHGSTPTD